jgi:hypothetical protein
MHVVGLLNNEQPKLTITFIAWSTFLVHVQKSIDVSILPMITQLLWYQMPYPFSILVPNVTPIMLMLMKILMGVAPLKTNFAIESLGFPNISIFKSQFGGNDGDGSHKSSPLDSSHPNPNPIGSMPMFKLINILNGVLKWTYPTWNPYFPHGI